MSWSDKPWTGTGSFTSDNLPYTSNNDQEYSSKTARLLTLDDKEGDTDRCKQLGPRLGLKLRISPSFLDYVQAKLHEGKADEKTRTGKDDSDKLKASNFPATFIRIGAWQRTTRNEGDLTAKLYYAKRKLVWEVLDGSLKSKIEIQWSDIIAIRAITNDKEPGILEIELHQPPAFYREMNPQPRKHTLWEQASDFTGGQAPTHRRHCVGFKPGILDRHYEKLLLFDQRLLDLSQKPFPINESPYFDPETMCVEPETMFVLNSDIPGPSAYHPEFVLNESSDIPGSSAYHPEMQQIPHQTYLGSDPIRSFPGAVTESPFQSEGTSYNYNNNQDSINIGNQGSFNTGSVMHSSYPYQNYQWNWNSDAPNHVEHQPLEDQSPQVSTGTYINNNSAAANQWVPNGRYMLDEVYSVPLNRTDVQQSNNAEVMAYPPNNSMHQLPFADN